MLGIFLSPLRFFIFKCFLIKKFYRHGLGSEKKSYTIDEMLSIFKSIEKSLAKQPLPEKLVQLNEFLIEDVQKPVLLTPKSPEEKVSQLYQLAQNKLNKLFIRNVFPHV